MQETIAPCREVVGYGTFQLKIQAEARHGFYMQRHDIFSRLPSMPTTYRIGGLRFRSETDWRQERRNVRRDGNRDDGAGRRSRAAGRKRQGGKDRAGQEVRWQGQRKRGVDRIEARAAKRQRRDNTGSIEKHTRGGRNVQAASMDDCRRQAMNEGRGTRTRGTGQKQRREKTKKLRHPFAEWRNRLQI